MSARRLAPLAWLVAMTAACGDGATGPDTVASLDVSPTAITLQAGQTSSLAGIPRDRSGTALVERSVAWTSANPSVATITTAGVVTGVAAGTTTVTGTSEASSGSATVTVLPPPPSTIEVRAALLAVLPGDSLRLFAVGRDARGDSVPGVTFTWMIDDARVASISASGLLTAQAPGTAVVFATAGSAVGSRAIVVVDPSAPRIVSITPDEMMEGQPAKLRGVNFDPVAAANVLTVDGIRATVTLATDSTLDIVVPPLGCRARHLADVRIAVGSNATRFSHRARPTAFFQLAPKQMTLLQDPAAYCLLFDAQSGDEEYLFGVQSTSARATDVASVLVVSDSDDGLAVASPAGPLPLYDAGGTVTDAPDLPFPLGWRAREAEVMRAELDMARSFPLAATSPARSAAALISGDVTVGTPVTVRYPDLDKGNTCSNYIELQGTVRRVTASGIWVSDNANPADGYQSADYDYLGDLFESSIYANQVSYFGPPADSDLNGRVVMVVTKEVNEDRIGGIVPFANVLPRSTCSASNEGEYFFMFASDPSGQFGLGRISTDQALRVAPSVVGHELVHNIHISRRYEARLPFWESWMYEGQATLGEEVLGHAINGKGPGQNYGWSIVRNSQWYYDAIRPLFLYYGWSPTGYDPQASGAQRRSDAPEACTWLDTPSGTNAGVCAQRSLLVYGVTWSFLRWISDHFGPSFTGGESAMHKAWIDGAGSGFASLEALTGTPIETLLAQWAASLYLDDRVTGLDPRLSLPSYDLLNIESSVVPEARLLPRSFGFEDYQQGVQVRAGSSAYFRVSGADRPSTSIRIRSSTGGFLDPSMQVWVVRIR